MVNYLHKIEKDKDETKNKIFHLLFFFLIAKQIMEPFSVNLACEND